MACETLVKDPIIISLDPTCLEDVFQDIMRVGVAAGSEVTAERLVDSLRSRIDLARKKTAVSDKVKRVACLEWLEPLMCAGHWVPEMIEAAGGVDCLGRAGQPSRRVEWEDVVGQQPDVLLVAPCGFDAQRGLEEMSLLSNREGWDSLPAVRGGQVYVGNANAYFSRSGPRLAEGVEILAKMLHPELVTGQVPAGSMAVYEGSGEAV